MPFGADATFVEPPSLPQVAATLVTSPSAARLLAWVAFTPMPALSAVPTAGRLAVAALAADEERREAALLDIARGD